MLTSRNLERASEPSPAAGGERPAPADAPATARRRAPTLRRLLALADVLALVAALGIALKFAPGREAHPLRFAWGLLTLPIWVGLFKAYGLYDRDTKRVSHSTVDDIPWIFHALLTGSLALWFYYKLIPGEKLILREGIVFFFVAGVGILLGRVTVRSLALKALPPERVLFLGGGPMARLLIQKISTRPEYGQKPVGYVDGDGAESSDLMCEIPFLGSLRDLPEICKRESIDRLVVAAPAVDEPTLTDLLRTTVGLELRISILPQVVDVLGPAVEIDDVEGITVLGLSPPALTRSSRFLKRLMDVAIALPLLVCALPLIVAIAIAIKATSDGSVLFSQERVGRDGRRFRMHKFRTMVRDAEERAAELHPLSLHTSWLLLEHDPRVTRFGHLLRQTSLDELPQLWNVLRGDMSLVGPRPMPPEVDDKIADWGRHRLDLTPGITGLWQVLGRTKIPFEEMVKLDYLYVTNWSLWQDVRLLIHTLPAIMRRRGVN